MFNLTIEFVGLSLFLWDNTEKKVWVMFPGSEHDGVQPHDMLGKHMCHVMVDEAHLMRNTPADFTGRAASLLYEGISMDLSGLTNDTSVPAKPKEIVDLTSRGSLKKFPTTLKGKPNTPNKPPRLLSRVALNGGKLCAGYIGKYLLWDGGSFDPAKHVIPMTNSITWTLPNVNATQFGWPMESIDGGAILQAHCPLKPVKDEVRIRFVNGPVEDLPPSPKKPKPNPGTVGHHFKAFYRIRDKSDTPYSPILLGEEPEGPCPVTMSDPGFGPRSVVPLTCMVAGGDM